MALVESSYYRDEDGLRQQVGQYTAPPPVRLQKGGFGKLALALVAAAGSVGAMVIAISATPQTVSSANSLLTMREPVLGGSTPSGGTEAQAEVTGDLNASRQLALLAGMAPAPESAAAMVNLNHASVATSLAVQPGPSPDVASLVDPTGSDTPEPANPAHVEETVHASLGHDDPSDESSQADDGAVEHSVLDIETRVPLPKQKPSQAQSELAVVQNHQAEQQVAEQQVAEQQVASLEPAEASAHEPAATQAQEAPSTKNEAPSTKPVHEPTPVPTPAHEPAPEFKRASATRAAQEAGPVKVATSGSGLAAGAIVLNPAPYAPITQRSANGLLPITGPAGEMSRNYYARPFPANDGRPRISIVIGGLGLSKKATTAAIDKLPPDVTLAFAPYGKNLQSWINKARSRGHEVLLELPMEPFDYPTNDPGPFTLLTNNAPDQNAQRLDWLLAQFNGYVGVTNYLGARFTSTGQALLPVLRELDERGLLVLDDGTSSRSLIPSLSGKMNVPWAQASRTVDQRVSRAAIDDVLLSLEDVARRRGSAIGMGFAYPVTIDRINLWLASLEQKGFVLAPVSANVRGSSSDVSFDQNANTY